jgi:DNA-binding MarR family transcriptional regulator
VVDPIGYCPLLAVASLHMSASMETFLSLLRAVDRDMSESRSLETWTLTTTREVAERCGMTRQRATPLLRSLLREGYLTRCEQPDSSVTWHLGDRGVRLLRGENEVIIKRRSGMSRAAGTIGATS